MELGQKVRDTVTGFEGRITGMFHWLYGSNRADVTSKSLHEGSIQVECIEVDRLEVVVDDVES